MSLKPFKFIVQAVVIEENEDGVIVGERTSEPQVFYGSDALKTWLDSFMTELEDKSDAS